MTKKIGGHHVLMMDDQHRAQSKSLPRDLRTYVPVVVGWGGGGVKYVRTYVYVRTTLILRVVRDKRWMFHGMVVSKCCRES